MLKEGPKYAKICSGMPVEMEVFILFSGLVRQDGLNGVERARQRQALVPDMRITMADPLKELSDL